MITRANRLVPMVEAFLNAPMPAGQVSEGKTINGNSCPEIPALVRRVIETNEISTWEVKRI